MNKRILWIILDLLAVIISGLYMIVLVLLFLSTFVQLLPSATRISNLQGDLTIFLVIMGGVFGILSLFIAALVCSATNLYSKTLLRNFLVAGLLSGIAAAVYYNLTVLPGFLAWVLWYMIISAALHIIELLVQKQDTTSHG